MWKEKNIIKICIPKWDKYDKNNKSYLIKKIKNLYLLFSLKEL
jgi:hypothetical protein